MVVGGRGGAQKLACSHAVMVGACGGGEPGCRCASEEDESRVLYEETLDLTR